MTISLPNNLTTEEKANLWRVYHHDLGDIMTIVLLSMQGSRNLNIGVPLETIAYHDFLTNYLECANSLAVCNDLGKRVERVEPSRVLSNMYDLTHINGAVSYGKELTDEKLDLFVPGVMSFVGSCVKNVKKHAYPAPDVMDTRPVKLYLSVAEVFPEGAVYIPSGARDFKRFATITVSDEGVGFPQEMDWERRFSTCPREDEHGFGFYFMGLLSKCLRAPIEVRSKEGNTQVSLYHPME